VEKGAKVLRSQFRGPAIIGEGTRIEDSVLGPNTSVSFGCTVLSSRIEDSIVMERCTIAGVRALAHSILGRDVEVRGSDPPGAHRLVVGDQSRLDLD
jgi:glucose-1-phosphate thymidylyltransferase